MSETVELSFGDSSGSEIQVPVQPVLSKEVASLLEHMLVFYDRLAAKSGDDADLRRKAADANRRVGDIRERLGQFEQSQAAYLRAIEGYRQIEEDTPADISVAVEIAGSTTIWVTYGGGGLAQGRPLVPRGCTQDTRPSGTASDPLPAVR